MIVEGYWPPPCLAFTSAVGAERRVTEPPHAVLHPAFSRELQQEARLALQEIDFQSKEKGVERVGLLLKWGWGFSF